MVKSDSAPAQTPPASPAPVKAPIKGDLSVDEEGRVRLALKAARVKAGDWASLARALRYKEKSIRNVAYGQLVTASVAVRLARYVGVGVDDLLSGKFCPTCGQRMPA